MVKLSVVFFLLLTITSFGQSVDNGVIKGTVVDGYSGVAGIYVINVQTEAAAITANDGSFTVAAKMGETILFAGMQYKSIRVLLTDTLFRNGQLEQRLYPIMNELNEVVIKRYDHINAVDLGLVSAGQRKYSVAERRLEGASALNPSASADGSGMAGGSVSADPIFNMFSGRTAMLKKELVNEKKEVFRRQLERMFSESYIENKLQIPADYVKGFEYYAVDNDRFTKILEGKNRVTIEFLLSELATKYKVIIAGQTK